MNGEKDNDYSVLKVKEEDLEVSVKDEDVGSVASGGNSERSFLGQFSISFLTDQDIQNDSKDSVVKFQQEQTLRSENECDNENGMTFEESIERRVRRKRDETTTDNLLVPYKRQCRGRRKLNAFPIEKPEEVPNSDESLNEDGYSKSNKLLFWSGLFYKIVETNDRKKGTKNIVAACLKCNVRIRGSLRVSSNFLSHLKSKHPEKLNEFVERKAFGKKKQPREKSTPKPVQQSPFPQKVLNFLSSGYYPLATVTNKHFINLFEHTGFPIPTEPFIGNLLKTECDRLTQNIKKHLSSAKYVCTSVDLFAIKSQSFIVYCCYWIGMDYKRKNTLLACKKIYGAINQETINAFIVDINDKFDLDVNKILCTTTNNVVSAKNVVKNLGFQKTETAAMNSNIENECDNVNEENVMSEKIKFRNIDFTIAQCLPCPVSSLDMVEKTQIIDVIKRHPEFYRQHKLVMQRVNIFWEYCSSSQFMHILKDALNGITLKPELSCWNNVYKSIKDIYDIQNALSNLTNELKLGVFEENEILYLEDYLKILKPITNAYEFLLRDDKLFFGNFFPALITVEVKFRKLMESKSLVLLQNLCKDIHDFIIVQFKDFFQVKDTTYDAVVAAVCIPSVKHSYLKNFTEFSDDDLIQVLSCYAREFYNESPKEHKNNYDVSSSAVQAENFDETSESGDDFYDFGHDKILLTKTKSKDFPIKREILAYLADETTKSFALLNKYPLIRSLFFKYNTYLPMTSFVERNLAMIGIIDGKDCPEIDDENFERMVFYRHYIQNKP